MTPIYANFLTPAQAALFTEIRRLVTALPDLDLGVDAKGEPILLSCHLLARALGQVLGLRHVDGKYHVGYNHSWLVTDDDLWIIDVYPIGALGGPIMVDRGHTLTSIGRHLYTPRRLTRLELGLTFSSVPFRRAVRRLVRELRRLQSQSAP
jgi:hypothetical protein